MSVQRKRKVDIEKIDEDTVQNIQDDIVKKITEINNEAVEKANKLLEIYGLTAKMQLLIEKKKD